MSVYFDGKLETFKVFILALALKQNVKYTCNILIKVDSSLNCNYFKNNTNKISNVLIKTKPI